MSRVRELIAKAFTLMNSDPQDCVRLSEEALDISREIGFGVGEGMALMHIGLGCFHQSKLQEALRRYLEAEPVLQREEYWYGLRCLYNNLGVTYRQWGDHQRALEYYTQNLDLENRFPIPKLQCTILYNLSTIHCDLGDEKTAGEYLTEALRLAEQHDITPSLALGYKSLGQSRRRAGDFKGAHKCFRKSRTAYEKIGDKAGLSHLCQAIAYLYYDEERLDDSLAVLNEGMRLTLDTGEKQQQASLHFAFARTYYVTGDHREMTEHLDRCLALAEEGNFRTTIINGLELKIKVSEDDNDFKMALELTRKRQAHLDFLNEEKRNRAIEEIKTRLQVQRREYEAEVLRLKTIDLTQRVEEEMRKHETQQQRLIQKSKMESLGRLAAGIAHEINQPLGMLSIGLQNLYNKLNHEKVTPDYLDKKQNLMNVHIERIKKIIEHIRLFSREQQSSAIRLLDVREVIASTLSMVQVQCNEHNIRLNIETADEPALVLGNPYRLEQVLLNLIVNAKDALEEKFDRFDDAKLITIACLKEGTRVRLKVTDNGPGIEEEYLQSVFEPFFTTKDEMKGTGLGLSICYGIVQEMGGTITCNSSRGEFTTFEIELPALENS